MTDNENNFQTSIEDNIAEPVHSGGPIDHKDTLNDNYEFNQTQLVAVTKSPPPEIGEKSKINPENNTELKATDNQHVGVPDVSQDHEELDRMNDSQVLKMGLLNNQPSDNKMDFQEDKKETTSTNFLPPIAIGIIRNKNTVSPQSQKDKTQKSHKNFISKESNHGSPQKGMDQSDHDQHDHQHQNLQVDKQNESDNQGSDYSESSENSGSEGEDRFDDKNSGQKGLLSAGLNTLTENKLMKGIGSGIGAGIGALEKGVGGLAKLGGFGYEGEKEDRSDEKSPAQLKQIFMDKYSIQLEIPSQDIQSSNFYPSDPNYLIQVQKYNLPKGDNYSVTTHKLDGSYATQSYDQVYADKKDGIILRLIKQNEFLDDCPIECNAVIKDLIPLKKGQSQRQHVSSAQIQFSPDGRYFIIFMKELDTVKIFEIKNNDLKELMTQINDNRYIYKFDDNDNEIDSLAFVKKIHVDINSKYIGLVGKHKIMVINIAEQMNKVPYEFDIQKYPSSRLETIYDVHIESTDNKHHPIKCFLACKMVGHKKIKIIDTFGHLSHSKDDKIINYFNEKASNFNVKIIHKDGNILAILANGLENFILECSKNGSTKQRNLSQLNNMFVHYIKKSLGYQDGFYIIASHSYDQNLFILNSENPQFQCQIKRNVLPGIITVQDMFITPLSQQTQEIRMSSLLDDEFVVDKIMREKFENEELSQQKRALAVLRARSCKYMTYKFSSISAFSTCWPFIVFSGLGPFVLISNVFNKEHLHRIQIGEEGKSCKICNSFISDTKDLFVMTLKDGKYMMYTLDLDNLNFFKKQVNDSYSFKLIFEYDDSHVEKKPLLDILVRGSSRKEVIQLNQKLIIFLLHDQNVYSWIDQKEVDTIQSNTIIKINKDRENVVSQSFQIVDNSLFYYQTELTNANDDNITQSIQKCEVLFGEYLIGQEYLEVSQQLQLMSFDIDQSTQNLLLIMRAFNASKGGKNTLYLKIWDTMEDRMIFENYLQNANLQGVLQSGAFSFVGNHIYYNNNVIKIRIDLMNQHKRNMTEEQLYCEYNDIFILEKGNRVKINSPLQAVASHRFTYIIYSPPSKPQPKKLMIMPYLHERKIYLNRMKMNTKYFYTTFQTNKHNEEEFKAVKNDVDMDGNLQEHNPIVQQGLETLIACMNLIESKYYLYKENGLLINRLDYSIDIREYGDIVTTSHDGLNFIFKKKNKHEFSILELSFTGFKLVKKIDIVQTLKKYINDNKMKFDYEDLFDDESWVNDGKRCVYQFMLNNNQDVVIKIKQNQGTTKRVRAQSGQAVSKTSDATVLFFITGWCTETDFSSLSRQQNDAYPIKQPRVDQKSPGAAQKGFNTLIGRKGIQAQAMSILILSSRQKYDFCINSRFMFVWDKKQIMFYDLRLPLNKMNKMYINFKISQNQKNAYVKTIVAGNDPDKVAIVVEQLQDCTIFSWDISENFENEAFNIDKDHSIIFDSKGNINILDKNCLTISQQLCRIKAFQIEDFNSRDATIHQKGGLGYSQGVRFDSEGNNWLILREYVTLPFSYMTFVIKQVMEDVTDFTNLSFDIEPYNYIINGTTCFLDGDMSRKNYLQLNYVLRNFERENLEYLQLLHYTKDKLVEVTQSTSIVGKFGDMANSMKNKVDVLNLMGNNVKTHQTVSPLSLALSEGNNRCVEIILSFMSKIDYNASSKFIHQMPNLTDYNSFMTYLTELPMQTQQMLEKQILKISDPWDNEIVMIADSQCVYIDDDFYQLKMLEDKYNPTFKSIPVKIEAMKVGWIINTDQGRMLLQNILQSDRLDYFDIPSLVMIIEFLYQRNKVLIFAMPMPMYLLQGLAFLTTIYVSEQTATEYQTSRTEENSFDGNKALASTGNSPTLKTISIINLVMTILQLVIMAQMFRKMGMKFLYRTYTWFDATFYIFNTLIFYRIYNPDPNMEWQRIFETFAIIFFLMKTFYFLKLFDKVAPLVSIVFQIVYDIKFFMIILIMAIFCFGVAFYLQGRNQMDRMFNDIADATIAQVAAQQAHDQFMKSQSSSSSSRLIDSSTALESAKQMSAALIAAKVALSNAQNIYDNTTVTEYSSFNQSIWYIWILALGGGDPSGFSTCTYIECQILTGLFYLSTFVFMLHLFNMLIAIMGDTFSKNNEIQNQIKIKDHLAFVLDNWYLNDLQKEKTRQIKYIMSAFAIHDETDDTEIIRAVYDRIDEIDEVMTKALSAISKKQNEQDGFLKMIIKNQDRILLGQNYMQQDAHSDHLERDVRSR